MRFNLFLLFFVIISNAQEEGPLSSRDARVASYGNNNVLSVSNNLARHVPAPSASSRLSQSEWQEAVANYLSKSDDLNLCPGSELLSPIEKQVGDLLNKKTSVRTNSLLISDLPKSPFTAVVLYVFED